MTLEELQDRMEGGTRGAGVVLWNGTRESLSGSKYLGSDDLPAVALPKAEAKPTLREQVAAALRDMGRATVRELADRLDADLYRVNATVSNMRGSGEIVQVAHQRRIVKAFGARMVAVYGLAS